MKIRRSQVLEARVVAQRIEHRVEPEQCGSERYTSVASDQRTISESSFCKAAMARSGPRTAATGLGSRSEWTRQGVFSIGNRGHGAFRQGQRGGLVTNAILVNARSPRRPKFSGCSLRKVLVRRRLPPGSCAAA